MKKLIFPSIVLALQLMTLGLPSQAQTIVKDAMGNYKAVRAAQDSTKTEDVNTGRTFTDSKGKIWPVYKSKTGRIYALRTSKTGKSYKQYLDTQKTNQ